MPTFKEQVDEFVETELNQRQLRELRSGSELGFCSHVSPSAVLVQCDLAA
jgi:hypothetical protein